MPNLQVWRGMGNQKVRLITQKIFITLTLVILMVLMVKHKEWHRITKNNYQTLGHYGEDLLYNDNYCMINLEKYLP